MVSVDLCEIGFACLALREDGDHFEVKLSAVSGIRTKAVRRDCTCDEF